MKENQQWAYKIFFEPLTGTICRKGTKEDIERFLTEDWEALPNISISHIEVKERMEQE